MREVSPPAFHGCKWTHRVLPQRRPDPSAFVHGSQPEQQLSADLRAISFPFFPATGQVHRRRAPAPGDTALEIVPAGSRWRLHMSISGIATIMDGLTLRKQRNSFVLLFKPMSLFSADTNQPSLIGVYKPTSVYFSYLQAQEGECTARRIPNTTVLLR